MKNRVLLNLALISGCLLVPEYSQAGYRHRLRQQYNTAPIWPLLLGLGVNVLKDELPGLKDSDQNQKQTGLPPAEGDTTDNSTIQEMQSRMLTINKNLNLGDDSPAPPKKVTPNGDPSDPKRPNSGKPKAFPN